MSTNKYHQAAVTYLIYGILYLGGALYAAAAGMADRGLTSSGALGWFVLGAVIVIAFPLFIWKKFKWFTRILAVLLLVRVGGLVYTLAAGAASSIAMPGGAELPMAYGTVLFLLITVVTCLMLIRAGWDVDWPRRRRVEHG